MSRIKIRELSINQERFLSIFSEVGVITKAAAIAGIDKSNHSKWLKSNEKYRERFEAAVEAANDVLIAECRRRAVEGVDEPVFYKGEQVDTVKKYSDLLLIFEMKRRMPEYRDKVDVSNQHLHKHELVQVYVPNNNRRIEAQDAS